jgi:hypothetical protein
VVFKNKKLVQTTSEDVVAPPSVQDPLPGELRKDKVTYEDAFGEHGTPSKNKVQ